MSLIIKKIENRTFPIPKDTGSQQGFLNSLVNSLQVFVREYNYSYRKDSNSNWLKKKKRVKGSRLIADVRTDIARPQAFVGLHLLPQWNRISGR